MSQPAPTADLPPAGVLRRLVATFYDALLLIALWMLGVALLLPLTGGEAVAGGAVWPLRLYLAAIAYAFFVGFWLRGGQTLGMRAWRIRLRRTGDGGPGLAGATLRFVLMAAPIAALALGPRLGPLLAAGLILASYGYSLFDRQGRGWHDLGSGTRLVVEPKRRG